MDGLFQVGMLAVLPKVAGIQSMRIIMIQPNSRLTRGKALKSDSRHLRGRSAAAARSGTHGLPPHAPAAAGTSPRGGWLRRSGSLTLSLRADGSDREEERTSLGLRWLFA